MIQFPFRGMKIEEKRRGGKRGRRDELQRDLVGSSHGFVIELASTFDDLVQS